MLFKTIEKKLNTRRIKIAGIPMDVAVRSLHMKKLFRDFKTAEKPLVSISLSAEDLNHEIAFYQAEMASLGKPCEKISTVDFEPTALLRKVAAELLPYGFLLFHGTVLALNGKAYMFSAQSGTGKTTHAKLWLKLFPECHILTGDKPFLLARDGQVYVYGSPWRGKEGYGVNECLPLEAICFLSRSETNHIEEVPLKDCFDLLLPPCYFPEGASNKSRALKLLMNLPDVRFYRLGCNMEDEAAQISYQGMVKE